MNCSKPYDILEYLKGGIAGGDREPARLHFESCAPCGRELDRIDRTLKAFGKLETIDPSPDFRWRVRQAFVAAHPELLVRSRAERWSLWETLRAPFTSVPAWALSIAVHAMLLSIGAALFLAPEDPEKDFDRVAVRVPPKPSVVGDSPDFGGPPSAHVPAEIPEGVRVDPARGPFTNFVREGESWKLLKSDRPLRKLAASRVAERSKHEGVAGRVARGLRWLASKQASDGRWPTASLGGQEAYEIGITGLALQAFLAEGHTHREGPYADVVGRGIRYLVSQQQLPGLIGPQNGQALYNHGVAGVALVECWMMTGDEALEGPARWAASFSLQAQNGRGGWDYRAGGPETDTSVGVWHVMLLRLARECGTDEAVPALILARERTLQLTDLEGRVGYRAPLMYPNGPYTLTALGTFAYLLSSPAPEPSQLEKYKLVLQQGGAAHPCGGSPEARKRNDLYFWHFASLALHQIGGPVWEQWNAALTGPLAEAQQADGSWPADFDRWSSYGGQVYTTAMATLTLQAPYRYPRFVR